MLLCYVLDLVYYKTACLSAQKKQQQKNPK